MNDDATSDTMNEATSGIESEAIRQQVTALTAALRPGLAAVPLEHARQRTTGVLGYLAAGEQLEVVCAYRCELRGAIAPLGELRGLRRLDVGDNQLTALPPQWSDPAKLTALRELYIYDNRLEQLPALGVLRGQLEVLDANRNRLTALPPLHVRFVYLAQNQLRHVPATHGATYLNVSDNPLESFEPADPALQELRAERCQLRQLTPRLVRLSSLRELSLRDNAIVRLPDNLAQLTRLEALDLRGNQLDDLPEALGALPALRKLDLRWNPLRRWQPQRPGWVDALARRGCAIYV